MSMSMGKAVGMFDFIRFRDAGKYARRILGARYLERSDFLPELSQAEIARMERVAEAVRPDDPEEILVFGVLPRSGTNYVRDILAMHPDVCADPAELYEFPLLHAASGAKALRNEFVSMFPRNGGVVGSYDMLAYMASAWLRSLQAEIGTKRILLKSPHVHKLSLATALFTQAKIVLCVRDGRDVVDSTMITFSSFSLTRKTFSQLAYEWKLATEAILEYMPGGAREHPNIVVVRYEDLQANEEAGVRRLLRHTGLPADSISFEDMRALPVRGASRSKLSNQDQWKPQDKSDDFKPVRRWQSWPKRKTLRFDRIAGATLRRAGYDDALG